MTLIRLQTISTFHAASGHFLDEDGCRLHSIARGGFGLETARTGSKNRDRFSRTLNKIVVYVGLTLVSDEWDRPTACALYRTFVAEAIERCDSPWEQLRARVYLGSEAFMERVKELTRERKWTADHLKLQQNVRAIPIESVRDEVERCFQRPSIRSDGRMSRHVLPSPSSRAMKRLQRCQRSAESCHFQHQE